MAADIGVKANALRVVPANDITNGTYIAEIRTGSHTGTLVVTLTVDCSAGEQNDFEYVFGLLSYDDNTSSASSDGFTQNLDLQEAPAGAAGAMTPNTGYWGPTI